MKDISIKSRKAGMRSRWDKPFGDEKISDGLLRKIFALPFFSTFDAGQFPDDLPLAGIIANDARILRLNKDQRVFRQGENGTSVFLILCGSVCSRYNRHNRMGGEQTTTQTPGSLKSMLNIGKIFAPVSSTEFGGKKINGNASQVLPDTAVSATPASRDNLNSRDFFMYAGELFGISSALNRRPRQHSVFANGNDTVLLEIRLAGLRELRFWSDNFRRVSDALYRDRALISVFNTAEIFTGVDRNALQYIAQHSRFEAFGSFNWMHKFKRDCTNLGSGSGMAEREPVIAEEGHYQNDIIIVHAGLVRLSKKDGDGERTSGLLKDGEIFGLDEFIKSQSEAAPRALRTTLRAIGYADIVRVPTPIFEDHIWPALHHGEDLKALLGWQKFKDDDQSSRPGLIGRARQKYAASKSQFKHLKPQHGFVDFLVDNRIINGTSVMAIDQARCLDCDECLRACAETHSGTARFIRDGKVQNNLMITRACMHCVDAVCLIDCPTGAIARNPQTGDVIIEEDICIGCAACANACPYDNIRMEQVDGMAGRLPGRDGGISTMLAVKCDHCIGNKGGAACQHACPTGALVRVDPKQFRQMSARLEEN